MLDANNRVQSRVLLPASARLGVTLWPCLYGSHLPCISVDRHHSAVTSNISWLGIEILYIILHNCITILSGGLTAIAS
jgi:hypothetical protein